MGRGVQGAIRIFEFQQQYLLAVSSNQGDDSSKPIIIPSSVPEVISPEMVIVEAIIPEVDVPRGRGHMGILELVIPNVVVLMDLLKL